MRKMLKQIAICVCLTAVIILLFHPLFTSPLPGWDVPFHAYKTEILKRWLTGQYHVDWDDNWNCGVHQFHYYSPLSYLVIATIDFAVDDIASTFKLSLILGFVLAAIFTYFFLKLLKGGHNILAIGAALIYALNPFTIDFIFRDGEVAAIFSIAFIPLTFAFLTKLLRKPEKTIAIIYGISLASTFLFHATFGILALIGGIAYAFVFILIEILNHRAGSIHNTSRYEGSYRQFVFLLCSVLLFMSLTGFWWIPYLTEEGLLALPATHWETLLRSVNPSDIVKRKVEPNSHYLGILPLLLSVLCLASRKTRKESLTLWAVFAIGILIAVGPNSPVYNNIPLLRTLLPYPERALLLCSLALTGLVYLSLIQIKEQIAQACRWRMIGVLLISLLVIVSIYDYYSFVYPRIGRTPWEQEWPSIDDNAFILTCRWLENQPLESGARIAFLYSHGPPIHAYSPILSGKPIMEWSTSYATKEAILYRENEIFLKQFGRGNVEFVVVPPGPEQENMLNNLLATDNFEVVVFLDNYTVLRYLGRSGFVQPLRTFLIIGRDANYKKNCISEVLSELSPENITFRAGKQYVDDYELSELKKYEGMVLWGFKYHTKSEAEKLLREYVISGGYLFVCMDECPEEEFLSVSSMKDSFSGSIHVIQSRFPLDSKLIPVYENGPWVTVHYRGLDENWLVIKHTSDVTCTIVGVKKIENRDVVFIGYNLFFHAAYHKNEAEKAFLCDLFSHIISPAQKQHIEYELVSFKPHEKIINVRTSSDGYVFISHSYSTHWRATVDGQEREIQNHDGFISIWLEKGSHQIILTYVQTPIHYLANSVSILAFIGMLLTFVRDKIAHLRKIRRIRRNRQ
ncbi:MAG: 6-pyruvoyl-tetrahydropterin synthase-related protein [Candidatus Hadarchaeales archaeon]